MIRRHTVANSQEDLSMFAMLNPNEYRGGMTPPSAATTPNPGLPITPITSPADVLVAYTQGMDVCQAPASATATSPGFVPQAFTPNHPGPSPMPSQAHTLPSGNPASRGGGFSPFQPGFWENPQGFGGNGVHMPAPPLDQTQPPHAQFGSLSVNSPTPPQPCSPIPAGFDGTTAQRNMTHPMMNPLGISQNGISGNGTSMNGGGIPMWNKARTISSASPVSSQHFNQPLITQGEGLRFIDDEEASNGSGQEVNGGHMTSPTPENGTHVDGGSPGSHPRPGTHAAATAAAHAAAATAALASTKPRLSLTMDEKRLRRLVRNREAARKNREKKKEWVENLKNSNARMVRQNKELEEKVKRLREEYGRLRSVLGRYGIETPKDGMGPMSMEMIEQKVWQTKGGMENGHASQVAQAQAQHSHLVAMSNASAHQQDTKPPDYLKQESPSNGTEDDEKRYDWTTIVHVQNGQAGPQGQMPQQMSMMNGQQPTGQPQLLLRGEEKPEDEQS